MSDLLLIFVDPLPCDENRDPALLVNIGQPRFWLQIGVFLP